MDTSPNISVLLPLYDGAYSYLDEAIESIRDQTLSHINIHIIACDTPQNILELIKAYAKKDTRISVFSKAKTILEGINTVIQGVKTPYIALMHPDDIALPDRLEHQLHFIKSHPEVIGCGGAVQTINHGNQIKDTLYYATAIKPNSKKILVTPPCPSHCLFIKTEYFRSLGGLDINLKYTDVVWLDFIRRLSKTHVLGNTPDIIQFERITDTYDAKDALDVIHHHIVAVGKHLTPNFSKNNINLATIFDRRNPSKLDPLTQEGFALFCLIYCFEYLEKAHREKTFRLAMQLLNRQNKKYHRYLWGYLYEKWMAYALKTSDPSLYIQSLFGLLTHNPLLFMSKIWKRLRKTYKALKP